MYIEGFKEGEPYTSLTRCIAINLISHGFKLNSEVHSAYRILEQQTYQQLTDLLEIHFLNLSAVKGAKIRQTVTTKKQEKLINWLRFIETDDKEKRAMLATTSPILQMLNEKIDVLSLSPEERKLYESRMKLKSDIATISEIQYNAGIERGISQGSHQKAIETAKILKQLGDSVQKIVQVTGLTVQEVEKSSLDYLPFEIYSTSALSHRQNYTSVYSFDCEFRAHAKHRFWLIRAASMPLLKMLNVAERTRMSVVPRGS